MSHKSFWDQDLNVLIDTIENNSKFAGSHSQMLLLNAHYFTNSPKSTQVYLLLQIDFCTHICVWWFSIPFCRILNRFYSSVKRPALILITTHIGVMRLVCQGPPWRTNGGPHTGSFIKMSRSFMLRKTLKQGSRFFVKGCDDTCFWQVRSWQMLIEGTLEI